MTAVEYDPRRSGSRLPPAQARWLRELVRGVRRPLLWAMAVPLLAGALLPVQAWLLADVLGTAVAGGVPVTALPPALAVIAGLVLARAGLAWAGERAGATVAEAVKRRVREAVFAELLARGPIWMRTQSTGDLAAVVVEQVEALDGFFARYLPAMVSATFLPIAFALVLLPQDVVVAVLLLVTAPLIPVFMALVGWGAEAASRRHMDAFARLSGRFADRLRGLATLKLHGRADDEVEGTRLASEALRVRTMAVLRIAFLSSAVLEFFAALGVASVALYAGLSYLGLLDLRATPLTLATGLFCLLMAPEVYAPLRQLAAHYHDRGAARAAVVRLAAVLDTLPATVPPLSVAATPSRAIPAGRTPSIAAVDLSVELGGQRLFHGVSFALDPGETVALLGESGSGKSTLLEILFGLRRPQGGRVLLDGLPVADLPPADLRRRVAWLGQRPRLFAGSIADNIWLADPRASGSAVREAARRAGVLRFAGGLPDGLDTAVGERGIGLSGGEIQRIALARVLLRDAGLMLLDEPTAHLDAETEAAVLDAILEGASGTVLIATHSAAVAARCGRALGIVDGRIREFGDGAGGMRAVARAAP